VAGITPASKDLALSRFDASGNLLWKKILPHADYKWAGQTGLVQTKKANIYYSGLNGVSPITLII
jgi:beta-mannanase